MTPKPKPTPPVDPPPPVVIDGVEYYDAAGCAARHGITLHGWHGALRAARVRRAAGKDRPGLVPEPDLAIPGKPLWLPETFWRWRSERVGQGMGGGRPRKVVGATTRSSRPAQ